jgi:predicted pyridoxine 5'-phosphate oxidase superfamily flavin-nucleotide-binding protein
MWSSFCGSYRQNGLRRIAGLGNSHDEHPSVNAYGRTDTLRVKGKASITTDPTLLDQFEVRGKCPQSALMVTVDQAWLHCGKALMRSQLWEPEAQVAPDALPTVGQMCADQITGDFNADAFDKRQQRSLNL